MRFPQPRQARPEEWPRACELLFSFLDPDDAELRTQNALHLLENGEVDPEGLIVLEEGNQLTGMLLCQPVGGATALVWPPRVVLQGSSRDREDRLIRYACTWLRQRGVKLAQCLLAPAEIARGEPLLRHDFRHICHLWYMRHDLQLVAAQLSDSSRLQFSTFAEVEQTLFQDVLLQSYQDSLDCPEVTGARTIEEVLTGHQSQGQFDPSRWWLAHRTGEPVGVILTSPQSDTGDWDLSYLGVVPPARRQGFGKDMLNHVLVEARAAGALQLTLSVDGRNLPAQQLYRSAGFEVHDRREILLAIWPAL
jgi:ribosomal protein S18 acetylase RimI-like enzyme